MKKTILFGKDYLDKATEFAESNKTLMFMVIVFLVVVLLLIKAIISHESTVNIEFPKAIVIEKNEPISAGNNFGNEGFWRLWGIGVLEADWTHIEPNTIDSSVAYLSSLMDEKTYVRKNDELEAIKEITKKNSLRMRFDRREAIAKTLNDGAQGLVIIKGLSSMRIGSDEPVVKQCSFEFEFEKKKGAVYVKEFNTDCFNLDGYGDTQSGGRSSNRKTS